MAVKNYQKDGCNLNLSLTLWGGAYNAVLGRPLRHINMLAVAPSCYRLQPELLLNLLVGHGHCREGQTIQIPGKCREVSR